MDCLHPAQQALLFLPSNDLQQYKTDPTYFWISIATKHYGMRKKKMNPRQHKIVLNVKSTGEKLSPKHNGNGCCQDWN
jgi:hypothetical protein